MRPQRWVPLEFWPEVFQLLRQAFPKAELLVRLDGGFACPEILDFLETQGVHYAVAMAGNDRARAAVRALDEARTQVPGAKRANRACVRRASLRRQELVAQAAHHRQGRGRALHERVLPRTSRRANDLLDPHAPDSPLKCAAIDRIAIS